MSKMDVNLYYLQVQNDYFEMLDNLREFKELAGTGQISQEDYDKILKEVELLKSNYERISYIIMLLNKPNRKNNENADMNRSWYAALSGASKEVILQEDRDVLVDLKKLIAARKGEDNE